MCNLFVNAIPGKLEWVKRRKETGRKGKWGCILSWLWYHLVSNKIAQSCSTTFLETILNYFISGWDALIPCWEEFIHELPSHCSKDFSKSACFHKLWLSLCASWASVTGSCASVATGKAWKRKWKVIHLAGGQHYLLFANPIGSIQN
jgi:hypothetical protein